MFRPVLRSAPRALRLARPRLASTPRRYASTSPASKPRTWKGSALRWGIAVAAVYWYNTSPIFADEPTLRTIPAPPTFSDDDRQTVDAVINEKRQKAAAAAAAREAVAKAEEAADPPETAAQPTVATSPVDSPAALEEEADQQGAFNPETGEINWDCPCLGGMADGPCGEEFKTAFSCFVFSKEEPKGMDCIDKFQGMQECFRKYPEIYGSELTEADSEEADMEAGASAQPPPESPEHPDGSATLKAADDASVGAPAIIATDVSSSRTTDPPKDTTPPQLDAKTPAATLEKPTEKNE